METLADNLPAILAAAVPTILVIAKVLNKATESWGEGSTFRRILKMTINLLDAFRSESVKDAPKILKKPKTS